MSFNIATILYEADRAWPGKTALIADDDTPVSYRELAGKVRAMARALRASGLRPGDRVVVQLPNTAEFALAFFAAAAAGLVPVPVNPLLKAAEIGYVLADSGARMLVTDESCAAQALAAARDHPAVTCAVRGTPPPAAGPGVIALSSLTRDSCDAQTAELAQTYADDTAVMIYTSGTTGRPKGAELTHFHLYMNATIASEMAGVGPGDVALGALPLFHVYGLSGVLLEMIRRGGTVVLMSRFDARAALDRMRRHGVTLFHGVPTMFLALVEELAGEPPVTSLRTAFSGGAAMPRQLIRACETALPGAVVLEGYGLSETCSATTFNYSAAERKPGSVGKPLWGVEVRVADEAGEPLPPGPQYVGEVLVRGFNVMKGYFGRPEATAEALRGGWLHTGDLGYLDSDGYLFIVDRKKDLIIRGGYNVYPREVEEVLYTHPAVAEAGVIGCPDDRLGEEVLAFVVRATGHAVTGEELIAYCRERMAGYKYPRGIRIVDELPKGPTGKIDKRALRRLVP